MSSFLVEIHIDEKPVFYISGKRNGHPSFVLPRVIIPALQGNLEMSKSKPDIDWEYLYLVFFNPTSKEGSVDIVTKINGQKVELFKNVKLFLPER